ncbi:hypothetical protein SSS_00306 [Sarcoptes scabiei]|uniref:Uncharacterized protein n=1 Tax=Sarcoptes scabiei TaxID=52283 RepID=A0A834RFP1_SARSC|nr:hypothetical protein SSS_00306 [Sarcoptes scabiei]
MFHRMTSLKNLINSTFKSRCLYRATFSLQNNIRTERILSTFHSIQHEPSQFTDFPLLNAASKLIDPTIENDWFRKPLIFYDDLIEKLPDENFFNSLQRMIEPNSKRIDSLLELSSLINHRSNYLEFLLSNQKENIAKLCQDFRHLDHFCVIEEFILRYLHCSTEKITGLLSLAFIKLIAHSEEYCRQFQDPNQFDPIESDQMKNFDLMADCYDLIDYGIYFHDSLDQLNSIEKLKEYGEKFPAKISGLFTLMGDLCQVRSSLISSSNLPIDYIMRLIEMQLMLIESEASCTKQKQFDTGKVDDLFNASLELLDELAKFPYGTLNHFVYYCYKNNGSTLGGLMRFFTKKYGLNVKAQNFAMDLGVCLGIANKMYKYIDFEDDSYIDSQTKSLSRNSEKFSSIQSMSLKRDLMQKYISQAEFLIETNLSIGNGTSPFKIDEKSLRILETIMKFIESLKYKC